MAINTKVLGTFPMILFVLSLTLGSAPAAQAAPGDTIRVSVSSTGAQGNAGSGTADSGSVSISADGRYIAFISDATNLIPEDATPWGDIFVYDRQTAQTTIVSVASDGTQANAVTGHPSISADGRYLAFDSTDAYNLINGQFVRGGVFVHDLQTGVTSLASVASDGTPRGSPSLYPSISADGRYVAFESFSSDLVSDDTNSHDDVFVHDMQTGETRRVSVASDGTQANSDSRYPSISPDGRYVAFESWATQLVSGDTNGTWDVFVHDLQTGETTLFSKASDGTQGDTPSHAPSISGDGRYVAFESASSTLVSGDTNGVTDIFVHDRQTGETARMSETPDGLSLDADSHDASISADGRYVVFWASSGDVQIGYGSGMGDIFVRDRQTGTVTLASVALDGFAGNGSSWVSSISAAGGYVAFVSWADNLVADDTNEAGDVFVYENANRSKALFRSIAAQDGWVLESTETSGRGGSKSVAGKWLRVGDDAQNRQYRSVISFDTSRLPDTAIITRASIQMQRVSQIGTNPFRTHGQLRVDIRKPYFGGSPALAIGDFQARASQPGAGSFVKMADDSGTSGWYAAELTSAAYPFVNLTGKTQFRLRFAKDDNNDMGADYLGFCSAEQTGGLCAPILMLEYYLP